MNRVSRPLPKRTEPPPPLPVAEIATPAGSAIAGAAPARRTSPPPGGGDAGAGAGAELALISRISAGLAQELGNPLGIASMNLDVVRAEYDRLSREGGLASSALGPALLDLESSVVQMQSVVAHLRPFAGATRAELAAVPVADVVSRLVKWAGAALRGIDVEVCVQPVAAFADPTMLEQIVLHLTSNAACAASVLPSPRIRYHVYKLGDRVVVSVRDNGPGMTDEVREKIFEPFFTTRRSQGRSGLGLALCREYARRMGATLSVSSAPGEGACFRLSLESAPAPSGSFPTKDP
jgi:two-component system C4-dicarboxylate transport sensor histidine kinase DctB